MKELTEGHSYIVRQKTRTQVFLLSVQCYFHSVHTLKSVTYMPGTPVDSGKGGKVAVFWT